MEEKSSSMSVRLPVVQVIGPTPPPHHGVSVATEVLLSALPSDHFRIVHLDTADRRGIAFVNQPDLWDFVLFVRQWLSHVLALLVHRPHISYLPLSQSRIGFIRDSLFIVPALLCNAAIVVHMHGANFDQVYRTGGPLFQWYVDRILERVRKFVVLGEMLRPIFERWAEPGQIAVVPNGVPEGNLRGPAPEGSPKASIFRIVFLSTLKPAKGLFVLLEALALVVQQQSDFECHIAGPWAGAGVEQNARTRVRELGLESHVMFCGVLTGDAKMQFLKSGDVFVFPGVQQEGQPLAVLEAMCAGLPVIATDRGCLRETVVDGVTGFVVPPNSSQAIADRIIHLMRDSHARRRLAAESRGRYEREYTMSVFAARMADLFAQVIHSNGPETVSSASPQHWNT